ncbi:MAG: flagellar basal-body rod protein FlgC [Gemmatimonadota bacterium]|nr:MAG: flagellar basal-body rod protein FlgC [Gemmatimonadota bacterium]
MSMGNLFNAFDVSAAGLSAQRARLNVISANLANVETTRTPEGGPYRRRTLQVTGAGDAANSDLFQKLLSAQRHLGVDIEKTSARHLDNPGLVSLTDESRGLQYGVVADEDTPMRMEFDPGHPDANEDGYVEYPNVEVVREMVDLMAASRAYEANVTVLNATKAMLRKALEI